MKGDNENDLKCARCGKVTDYRTVDHVVPKWLSNKVKQGNMGVQIPKKYYESTEMVCSPCNRKKGGKLYFKDKRVRVFLRELIKQLESRLSEE